MKSLKSDVDNVLNEFSDKFKNCPELFLDEFEIRNTIFRMLLENLVHNSRYPEIDIKREYLVNSSPRVKFDIAIVDKSKKLLVAIEIKYSYSNVKKLFEKLQEDKRRLNQYSSDDCQCYLLFYNNYEDYPIEIVNQIKELDMPDKIDYIAINLSVDKIKFIQQKYMADYSPTFKVN